MNADQKLAFALKITAALEVKLGRKPKRGEVHTELVFVAKWKCDECTIMATKVMEALEANNVPKVYYYKKTALGGAVVILFGLNGAAVATFAEDAEGREAYRMWAHGFAAITRNELRDHDTDQLLIGPMGKMEV